MTPIGTTFVQVRNLNHIPDFESLCNIYIYTSRRRTTHIPA